MGVGSGWAGNLVGVAQPFQQNFKFLRNFASHFP
jgi:hypothetical protein